MTQIKSTVVESWLVAGGGGWGGLTENHCLMSRFHIFIEMVVSWIYTKLLVYLSELVELQFGCLPEASWKLSGESCLQESTGNKDMHSLEALWKSSKID